MYSLLEIVGKENVDSWNVNAQFPWQDCCVGPTKMFGTQSRKSLFCLLQAKCSYCLVKYNLDSEDCVDHTFIPLAFSVIAI